MHIHFLKIYYSKKTAFLTYLKFIEISRLHEKYFLKKKILSLAYSI